MSKIYFYVIHLIVDSWYTVFKWYADCYLWSDMLPMPAM